MKITIDREGYIKFYNDKFAIWLVNQYKCIHDRKSIDLIQIGYLYDAKRSRSISLALFGFGLGITLYETFSERN
mgnify:CR=1 FL=1